MAEDGKTYQPGWGERKRHHHHHHSSGSKGRSRGFMGSLRERDKQAYYGFILFGIVVTMFGVLQLGKLIVKEIRSLPMDDPAAERTVDELRIHKVEEEDALLLSDSLAQAENVDSIRRKVQINTIPVYRPPRRESKWYITQREWKKIWQEFKVMRWEYKHDKEKQANDKDE